MSSDQLKALFNTNSLSTLRISPNQTHLAFTLSEFRGQRDVLIIWQINNPGEYILGPSAVHDFEWGFDENVLLYTEREQLRATSLRSFSLIDQKSERLFLSDDPRAHLRLSRSNSQNFIFLIEDLARESKVSTINLRDKKLSIKYLNLSEANKKYNISQIEHNNHLFFALFTGSSGADQIMSWDDNCFEKCSLETLYKANSSEQIELIRFYGDVLAFQMYSENTPKIKFLKNEIVSEIPIEKSLTKVSLIPEIITPSSSISIRYSGEGPFYPPTLFEWNDLASKPKSLASSKVPIEISEPLSDYKLERIFIKASDNIAIPLSIRYRVSKQNENLATVLSVYGAYGEISKPSFSAEELYLLNKGYRLATAHVRGGGELGHAWHNAAVGQNKWRSVTDLIDATKWLIKNSSSKNKKIILRARSAGGLIGASAALKEPELFSLVKLDRPFLDVRSHAESAPDSLSAREIDEWGDPKVSIVDHAIKTYSPMEIEIPSNFPFIWITTGLKDDVIQPKEILNWLKRFPSSVLANYNELTHFSRLLLTVSKSGTHTGETSLTQELEQLALEIALIRSKETSY